MKLNVGIFLSMVVVIHGAAIEIAPFMIAPDTLFENAWRYQTEVTDLQNDIDEQLTAIRTAVSGVLKDSSSATLTQIEGNANALLKQEAPARDAIFALPTSLCVINLRVLLNGITEFTGFRSSNCVTDYDAKVKGELEKARTLLQKYEGDFGNVLQIVVRSFIGKNVFLMPEEIEERFVAQFNLRNDEWAAIRPDVENFVNTLRENITGFNTDLGTCYATIEMTVAPLYDVLQGEIATCEAFNSTPDPFAMYR